MSATMQPLAEISKRATDALIKELGVADTIRFLNQFRTGVGDYTVERERLLSGMSVADVVREVKAKRESKHDSDG